MATVGPNFITPLKELSTQYANANVIVCAILVFLAFITVALRFYTRIFVIHNAGWDDVFVLLSFVTFTCFCVLFIAMIELGARKFFLNFEQLTIISNLIIAVDSFYVVTMAFFKISLGLFFLRVLVDQRQRAIAQWIIYINTAYSVFYFFFAVFQCGKPGGSHFWIMRLENKCSPVALDLALAYLHAILTAGSDLIFMGLSVVLVRESKIQFREKFVIASIMIFGTTGCIASLIRIKYVPILTRNGMAFLYDGAKLGIWSAIEPGLGIIASSLATTRPLIRHIAQSTYNNSQSSTLFGTSMGTTLGTTIHASKQTDSKFSKFSDDFVFQGPTIEESQLGKNPRLEPRVISPADLEKQSLSPPPSHARLQPIVEHVHTSRRPSLEQRLSPSPPTDYEMQTASLFGLQTSQDQIMAITRQIYNQSLPPRIFSPTNGEHQSHTSNEPQTWQQQHKSIPPLNPRDDRPSQWLASTGVESSTGLSSNSYPWTQTASTTTPQPPLDVRIHPNRQTTDQLPGPEAFARKGVVNSGATAEDKRRSTIERRRLAAESKRWAARKAESASKAKGKGISQIANRLSIPKERRRSLRFGSPSPKESSRNSTSS